LLLIFESQLPEYDKFYGKYSLLVNACLFALVVIVGSVFEGLSTLVEVRWDKEREATYGVEKNWYDYLALVCAAEPVGFQYISRTVTSLYFELAMMWASVLFGLEVIVLLALNSMPLGAVIMFVFTVLLPLYFRWQAKKFHKVLAHVINLCILW